MNLNITGSATINGHMARVCPVCKNHSVLPNKDGCYSAPNMWINETARCLSCGYAEMVAPDGYEEEFTTHKLFEGRKIIISAPYLVDTKIEYQTIEGIRSLWMVGQNVIMGYEPPNDISFNRYWAIHGSQLGWVYDIAKASRLLHPSVINLKEEITVKMRSFQ